MENLERIARRRWKPPLQPKYVWSIRVRLEMKGALRECALSNLSIDSKLKSL